MEEIVEIPDYSLFQNTPIYKVPGPEEGEEVLVFGLLVDPIGPAPGDQPFTITQIVADRIERVSSGYYGDPNVWWIIPTANRMIDPFMDTPTGTRIKLPTRARVNSLGLLGQR